MIRNRAAHFINSFISNLFGPDSKTCTSEVRASQGRVSRGLTLDDPNGLSLELLLFSQAYFCRPVYWKSDATEILTFQPITVQICNPDCRVHLLV